jgi:hypothetical protein
MDIQETSLDNILSLTGIFRMDKQRWPLHAAELQSFALDLGRSLDFSRFHRFRFKAESLREVILDYCLSPSASGWSMRGEAKLRMPDGEGKDQTLPLSVEISPLEPQRVETKSYCLIA